MGPLAAAFPSRRRSGIRWDRVGRVALLGVLVFIVLLYVSPARHWIKQSGTASHQEKELRSLKAEHERLTHRLKALKNPATLEREARELGMVRQGERAYVIENLK